MAKNVTSVCFACQKTNPYRPIDRKSVVWSREKIPELVEELCGVEAKRLVRQISAKDKGRLFLELVLVLGRKSSRSNML